MLFQHKMVLNMIKMCKNVVNFEDLSSCLGFTYNKTSSTPRIAPSHASHCSLVHYLLLASYHFSLNAHSPLTLLMSYPLLWCVKIVKYIQFSYTVICNLKPLLYVIISNMVFIIYMLALRFAHSIDSSIAL